MTPDTHKPQQNINMLLDARNVHDFIFMDTVLAAKFAKTSFLKNYQLRIWYLLVWVVLLTIMLVLTIYHDMFLCILLWCLSQSPNPNSLLLICALIYSFYCVSASVYTTTTQLQLISAVTTDEINIRQLTICCNNHIFLQILSVFHWQYLLQSSITERSSH